MIRRLVVLVAAGLVLGGLAAAQAVADAPVFKTNAKDVVIDVEGDSCEGSWFDGVVTVHVVESFKLDNGRFVDFFRSHVNGTIVVDYYQDDGKSVLLYSGIGRFVINVTERIAAPGVSVISETFPFKVNLDDGRVLKGNGVFHVKVNANGETTTEFENARCDLR